MFSLLVIVFMQNPRFGRSGGRDQQLRSGTRIPQVPGARILLLVGSSKSSSHFREVESCSALTRDC